MSGCPSEAWREIHSYLEQHLGREVATYSTCRPPSHPIERAKKTPGFHARGTALDTEANSEVYDALLPYSKAGVLVEHFFSPRGLWKYGRNVTNSPGYAGVKRGHYDHNHAALPVGGHMPDYTPAPIVWRPMNDTREDETLRLEPGQQTGFVFPLGVGDLDRDGHTDKYAAYLAATFPGESGGRLSWMICDTAGNPIRSSGDQLADSSIAPYLEVTESENRKKAAVLDVYVYAGSPAYGTYSCWAINDGPTTADVFLWRERGKA